MSCNKSRGVLYAILFLTLLSFALFPGVFAATVYSPANNAAYTNNIIDVKYSTDSTNCSAVINTIPILLAGCANFSFVGRQGINTMTLNDGTPVTILFTVSDTNPPNNSFNSPPPAFSPSGTQENAPNPQFMLDDDELLSNDGNPSLAIHSSKGTKWRANISIESITGTTVYDTKNNWPAPTARNAKVRFNFEKRHVKEISLRGVDLSGQVSLGYDEPDTNLLISPYADKSFTFVYAIDPTQLSFSDGTISTIASGTEVYKCANWDFANRMCAGSWIKILDTIPGVEYNLTLSPNDPGFAEMIPDTGMSLPISISDFKVSGSIPSPMYTTRNTWGLVVFNPTNRTINITLARFIASAATFGAVTGVVPSTGWTSTTTQINWTGSIVLGPNDVQEFIARVNGQNAAAVNRIISVNVTTNDSNFSTGGYQTYTSPTTTNIQYPAVYFLNASSEPTYIQQGVQPTSSQQFTVRVNNSGTVTVPTRSSLTIYVPSGWTNVSALPQTGWSLNINGGNGAGWMINPSTTTTIAAGGSRDFKFNATPPDLDDTYVYHSFGLFLSPSAVAGDAIQTTFVAGYQVTNTSPPLLDTNDNRYAITRTIGGARSVDVYSSVPAPAGRAGGNRWGAVVVNPTDNTISVTTINWTADAAVFGAVAGVAPAAGWTAVSTSNVRWTGAVNIAPHDAAEFVVTITGANALLAGVVNVTAITSAGTVSANGFKTFTRNGNLQYPAVYMVNSSNRQTYLDRNNVAGVPANITIRVNNTGGASTVPALTTLEIYVPSGWTNLTPIRTTGWTVRQIGNDDRGPNIIRATNNAVIASGGSLDFGFNATPPMIGTNSTYRLDAWLIGESSTVATMMVVSMSQLGMQVVPASYGIDFVRKSEQVANFSNVTTLTVVGVAKAEIPTTFNFSMLNVKTGAYDTINAAPLGTTEENWNITIDINSSRDPRNYINDTAGSVNYGKILVRWYTASENNTAIYEDWLFYNTTFNTFSTLSTTAPSSNIVLNAGSVRSVLCNASITDIDGNDSIQNVTGVIYLNGTSPTATDSNTTHYSNSSCLTTSVNGTSINATCSFQVLYYAYNGTWLCNISVNDSYGLTSDAGYFTIDPLYAINVTSTLMDFGPVSAGGISSNITQNFTNVGNQRINISVYGYGGLLGDNNSFTCINNINLSINLVRFAINNTANYSQKNSLSNISQQVGLSVLSQINSTPVVNRSYWQVAVPAGPTYNNLGQCNGTIVFQAETS